MCGIAGFVGARADMQEILQKMTDRIAHRGPDGEGHYIDGPVALGHRRLSIIDLEGGRQPMFNEDGSLAVVFTGEIYNFQPLREELIAAGHTFATRCDTEVLLHGYEQWGRELLTRLEERDRLLIELRYFKGQTQTQVAAQLGMTQVQVSRREKKILANLRADLLSG